MKIEEIIKDPVNTYLKLERYVNDGSISGFDKINTTSVQTSPYGDIPSYNLFNVELNDEIKCYHYGTKKIFKSNNLIIHPDMCNNPIIKHNSRRITKTDFEVVPIAGARTVYILPENTGYLKLNYDGILGRIKRQLSSKHALSSIEITDILERSINENKLPLKFSFLKESDAFVANLINPDSNNSLYEWGIVYREPTPYNMNKKDNILIPAFSLFSTDKCNPSDPPLLVQMIDNSNSNPVEYYINEIANPLLDVYFSILLKCGLQIECHSQNFLISISNKGFIDCIVIRDLESIDKDISLCKKIGIDYKFLSSPYKILKESDYNYQIKHSFMYDFKLGEYFFTPCINVLKKYYSINPTIIQNRIKDISNYYINKLPKSFFPSDCWYYYDNILFTENERRPYKKNTHLKYR